MMLRKLNVESWHSTGKFSGLFPRDLSNLSVVEGLQPVAEIANAALQLSRKSQIGQSHIQNINQKNIVLVVYLHYLIKLLTFTYSIETFDDIIIVFNKLQGSNPCSTQASIPLLQG